jgi:hypothetical protein
MNIDYLIQLLTNRLTGLALAKDQAFSSGDLERINTVDAEILDVQNTISKLKLVSNVEQAASASSLTESQIVQRGIESIFTPSVINGSTEVLLKYNIVPYATDPYHETKIQTILEKMPTIDSFDQIDIYLKKSTPDTPLTGLMIYNSAEKYNVDTRLIMAIMELDSRYGTQGLGARTFNPGNVGNNGFEERSYSSWEAGVDAVARWLNDHRIAQDTSISVSGVESDLIFTTTPSITPIVSNTNVTSDTATGITSTATSTISFDVASSTESIVPVSTSTIDSIATSTDVNLDTNSTATSTATTSTELN